MDPCQETELYIGLTGVVLSIATTLARKIKKQCVNQVQPKSLAAMKHAHQGLNEALVSKFTSTGDSFGTPKLSSTPRRGLAKRQLTFSDSLPSGEGTYFAFPDNDGSISVQAVSGGPTYVVPKNKLIANVQDAVNFLFGFDTDASTDYSGTYDSSTDGFVELSSYEASSGLDGSSFMPHVASTPNQTEASGRNFRPHVTSTPNQTEVSGRSFRPHVTSTPNQSGAGVGARPAMYMVIENPDKTYAVQRLGANGRLQTFVVPQNDQINSPVLAATFVFGGKTPDSGVGRTFNLAPGGSSTGKRTFVKQMPDGTFVVRP